MQRFEVCAELARQVKQSLELLRAQPDELLLEEPILSVMSALLAADRALSGAPGAGQELQPVLRLPFMRARIRDVLQGLEARRTSDRARAATSYARADLMNAHAHLGALREEDLDEPGASHVCAPSCAAEADGPLDTAESPS